MSNCLQQTIDIEALASGIPLLRGLARENIARLGRSTRILRVRKGDIVFHKGDTCTGLHAIVDGQVKMAFISRRGGERIAEILGHGQCFDEVGMLLDRPYVVAAQALTDVLILHIAKDAFLEVLDNDQKLCRQMLECMANHEDHLMAGVESCLHNSGRQRIIGYLVNELPEASQNGTNVAITLPSSKGAIASLLNLTHEHFSRILRDLTVGGLIVIDGRDVRIPCVDDLRNFSG